MPRHGLIELPPSEVMHIQDMKQKWYAPNINIIASYNSKQRTLLVLEKQVWIMGTWLLVSFHKFPFVMWESKSHEPVVWMREADENRDLFTVLVETMFPSPWMALEMRVRVRWTTGSWKYNTIDNFLHFNTQGFGNCTW